MARRQTPVLRNLDDPLRVLNLLSLRSCGLVLVAYGVANGLEAALGLFSLVFGGFAFLAELGVAALVGLGLALAERSDDEFLVPSALRYYWTGTPRVLWSGMGREPQGPRVGHGRADA
jgi:hypothetical protein